jgi:hypothetical protein
LLLGGEQTSQPPPECPLIDSARRQSHHVYQCDSLASSPIKPPDDSVRQDSGIGAAFRDYVVTQLRLGPAKLRWRSNVSLALDQDGPDRNVKAPVLLGWTLEANLVIAEIETPMNEDFANHSLNVGFGSPGVSGGKLNQGRPQIKFRHGALGGYG